MLSNNKVTVMLNNGNITYSYVHLSNTYDYKLATNNYVGVILNPTDILLYPDSEVVFDSVESQSRYLNCVLIHNIRDYRVYSQSYSEPSSYDYCKLQGTNIYLRTELYSGMIMDMPLIRTTPSQPDHNIVMLLSRAPYNRDTVVSFLHSQRNTIPTWAINNMRGLLDNDIENPIYIYTRDNGPTLVTISFQSNDNEAINSLQELISFKSTGVPLFDSTNTNSNGFDVSFFVYDSMNTRKNNITNFILMCKLLNVKPIYVTVRLNINEDDINQYMKIDRMFDIADMVA